MRDQGSGEAPTGRTKALLVLVGVSLCVVAVRLWSLQIANPDEFRRKGLRNRIRTVTLNPRRGCIYDRNGRLLVGNTLRYDASVDYSEMERNRDGKPQLFKVFQQVLGISDPQLRLRLHPRRVVPYLPVKIERGITQEQFYQLKSVEADVPGLLAEAEASRDYVEGSLAAHVLGAVGAISEEVYQRFKKWGYRRNDVVGIMGLEKTFERVLQGRKGTLKVQVDHRSRLDTVIEEVEPQSGRSLHLTLDLELQRSAENALRDQKGAIVALDPRNGDILAMASSPVFDPNAYSLPRSDEDVERIKNWGQDPDTPLYNRAISAAYPLGSTFKVVVGLAGLETNRISSASTFYCPGSFHLPGVRRPWRCYHNNSHGSVAVTDALRRSCNVFFYNLGWRLGVDPICSMAARLHLGQDTRMPLPMETSGINPDKNWRQKTGRKWYTGDTINLSIGQGPFEVTPVQTACAYAAIANGGTYFYPRIVEKVTGGPQDTVFPVRSERLNLRKSSITAIKEGLRRVAQEPGGTAHRVFEDVSFLEVAGKTGTAQYGPDNTLAYAWFVGYAPCDSPRIVVVVLIEEGETGGATSAPLAKQVLMDFFTMGG
jgi:penicillin-binding protein 2